MVRLPEFECERVALCRLATQALEVGQRRAPIGLRLAGAEQIEIRAVEDVDGLRHGPPARWVSRFIGTSRAKGKQGGRHGPALSRQKRMNADRPASIGAGLSRICLWRPTLSSAEFRAVRAVASCLVYLARLKVTSAVPPIEEVGTVYFISSPATVIGRRCSVPFQFGNELCSMWKVTVRSASLTVYLP